MAEQKRDPDEWRNYFWKCNRCYVIRTPLVGYCPRCASPEFTLLERVVMIGKQLNLF